MDIVDRMVHLFLSFGGVEMLFRYGVGDGCWRLGINGEPPEAATLFVAGDALSCQN